MDKVQKHNSFNTNTPSSESYRNYLLCMFRMFLPRHVSQLLSKCQEQLTSVLSLTHSIRMLAGSRIWSQGIQLLTLLLWMVMGILTSHTPLASRRPL